jgi:hypothetical protein
MFIMIMPRLIGKLESITNGAGMLDLQLAYAPDQVYQTAMAYGEAGRDYYIKIALTADFIYPLSYGLLLGVILTRMAWRLLPGNPNNYRLGWLGILPMLLDYGENASIVLYFLNFPKGSPILAATASAFTTLKWLSLFAIVALIAVGLFVTLLKRVIQRD